MKKWITILLAMIMLFSVCGAAAENADGAEPYGDGDGVISTEQLITLAKWLSQTNMETLRMVSFDTVCSAAGAQGQVREPGSDTHAAAWTDGNHFVTVTFRNYNDFWGITAYTVDMSSDVYGAADASALPHVGNRDAGSSPVEAQTLESKVKPSNATIAVTAEVPTEYWFTKVSFGEVRFLNCQDESRMGNNPASIRLAFYSTAEDLAADRDKTENVQELGVALPVLGQEMKGYTYTKNGMDMAEFEGQLADDLWIAVRLYDMIVYPGTEAEALLNSLTWEIK